MCKIAQKFSRSISVLNKYASYGRVGYVIYLIIFGSFLLLMLSACILDDQTIQNITPTAEDILTPEILIDPPLVSDLDELNDSSTQTAHPSLDNTAIYTMPTESGPTDLDGNLFIYDSIGIKQIAFSDNNSEYLLRYDTDLRASFGKNKNYLAYTIKQANEIEFWVTPLPHWNPERLLVIDDIEFDLSTPIWSVNDRYILFILSTIKEGEAVDEISNFSTYIYDMETKELVNEPFWPGDCFILAPSPKTNQLAIWCNTQAEQKETEEFLVLELNKAPWVTRQKPQSLTNKCFPRRCVWSADGRFVAYIEDEYPQLLFSASVDNPKSIQLDDKQTESIYGFPHWSPNGQYLYYTGACTNYFQKPSIMSVVDQKTIWCIAEDSSGEYGNISVVPISWSPDSRYLAIPIVPNLETELLIIDTKTKQEETRIREVDDVILDLIWTKN